MFADTLAAQAGRARRAIACARWRSARQRAHQRAGAARRPRRRARLAGDRRRSRRAGARHRAQGRTRCAPDTRTEEVFRGIADERARIAFSGHIHIERAAPGSRGAPVAARTDRGRAARRSICGRGWRSTPMRCARSTAPPPGGWMRICCSTCWRAASIAATARALLKWAFLGDVLRAIELPAAARAAEHGCGRPAAGRHGDGSADMSTKPAAARRCRLQPASTTSRACAPSSRSCRARSTASRWCIWTAPPPRSARWRCCARSSTTKPRCTPTCTAACIR